MDHFQQSHTSMTAGIKTMFEKMEQDNPEPEYQGLLATLRSVVHKYVSSPVPANDNELIALSQGHTMTLMAIENTASSIRRQKMWDRKHTN